MNENDVHLLSAPKIETLLAVLLIRSGQLTSINQLVGEIWPEEPPKRAVPALHVYVSQLRKFLSRSGCERNPIVTRSPGYLLNIGDDETDLKHFRHLMSDGSQHMRRHRFGEAVQSFQDALTLWRGPVLGELGGGQIIRNFATWLEDLRLQCIEAMAASMLMTGRHQELIPFLHSVAAEYPLNETFQQQLMLALYRAGRRAEALQVYQSVRDMLGAELGLEPCRALSALQQRILLADQDRVEIAADADFIPVFRADLPLPHDNGFPATAGAGRN